MNFSRSRIVVIIFLVLVGTFANAQENQFSITPTVGVGTMFVDGGTNLYIGVNPSLSLLPYLAVEGQLSYTYTKFSGFLTGEEGVSNAVNVLVGPRLYFTSQDKKVRPYINFLAGGMYFHGRSDINETSEFSLGISTGPFIKINQFTVGISFDTPQNRILKVGYTF